MCIKEYERNRHIYVCEGRKNVEAFMRDTLCQLLEATRPANIDAHFAVMQNIIGFCKNCWQDILLRNYINESAKPGTETALQLPEQIRRALVARKER
eukprot:IDg22591t1